MGFARKLALAAMLVFGLYPAKADAGCGCEKPPPPLAAIRPAFASPGNEIVLFAPGIVPGERYSVTFHSAEEVTVLGRAKFRRDLADGVHKPQLAVTVPDLPLGPTSVTVSYGATLILEVEEHEFTVLSDPIPLPEANLQTMATCYRAAVGADSTVYVPIDVSAIDDRMVFLGRADGYRLTYGAEDIAIYNTQGVLMQLLGPQDPNLFAIYDEGEGSSFTLAYDRHEFQTYRALHVEDDGFAPDPEDHEWHVNGSRHTDHDHIVVAITGLVNGEELPPPGETPEFTFRIFTWMADGDDDTPGQPTIVQDNCGDDGGPGSQLRGRKRRRGAGNGRGNDPEPNDPTAPLVEPEDEGDSGQDDDASPGADDGGNDDGGTGTAQGDEGDDGSTQGNRDGDGPGHGAGGRDDMVPGGDGGGTGEPESSPCDEIPLTGCAVTVQPGKAQLVLNDKSPDSRDGLLWKWVKGEQTDPGDFGNLMATDSLALCVYDESAEAPMLIFDAAIPANASCSSGSAGKPCWRGAGEQAGGYGQYKYRNRARTPDGIEQAVLKSGSDGKAKLIIKGKGENLDLPVLPLDLPVRVQLQAGTGSCWEATHYEAGSRGNSSQKFTGTGD